MGQSKQLWSHIPFNFNHTGIGATTATSSSFSIASSMTVSTPATRASRSANLTAS